MSAAADSGDWRIASRYNLSDLPEWQKLRKHFELSEGFALIVLLVLDCESAVLCRRELEKQLEGDGRKLFWMELPTPADLRQLPSRLLSSEVPKGVACLWIEAVKPDYAETYFEWREAWQLALARLNTHRNPIRDRFDFSLVFVGAPWLQKLMREIAPDLWSVRTLVVRIEPPMQSVFGGQEAELWSEAGEATGGDPQFALEEAEKLRNRPGKESALARVLHRAGEGFAGRHDWRSATKCFAEALKLKIETGAPGPSLISTMYKLANANRITGHVNRSVEILEQALVIASKLGDKKGEENVYTGLGNSYLMLGESKAAGESYERSLAIARALNDRRGIGSVVGNLGNIYAGLGDLKKAIEFYEQSLAIARELGDKRMEGNAIGNLGHAYRNQGDFQRAIGLFEHSLEIAREIGNRNGEGTALRNLGVVFNGQGDGRKAVDHFGQALAIARETGDRRTELSVLVNLGISIGSTGDAEKALDYFNQALATARAMGDRREEGAILMNVATALHQKGEHARAIASAGEAIRILEAFKDPRSEMARTHLNEWMNDGAREKSSGGFG